MKNEAKIDGITVGGQPTAEELASGRFQTIINVRGEAEPGNDTAEILPEGVSYTAVPWTIETVNRDDIARIRAAVEAAEGPILIHCMGATRAATAAAIVSAEKHGTGAAGARKLVADAGFEIAGTPYATFIDTYLSTT
ncbi:MAG: hypothetical protein IAI48_16205 [Candidatus Eremiobacteraeota bacterium]|nr:hypothetical protein [Candidatus Eremiobacteraeota bacterium]